MIIEQNKQIESATTTEKVLLYSDLTNGQKLKFAIYKPYFLAVETVIALVLLTTSRGQNSLNSILAKLKLLLKSDKVIQRYHDALYERFALGEEYLFDQIIGEVMSVRMEEDLDAFTSRFKANCEQEFLNLFIIEEVKRDEPYLDKISGETKIRKTLVGYKPVFKLKSED